MYVQSSCHVLSGLLINSNCCFDFLVSDPSHLFLIIMQVTTSLQNTIPWIMMKKGATKARSQFALFIFILFICLFLFHFILFYFFFFCFLHLPWTVAWFYKTEQTILKVLMLGKKHRFLSFLFFLSFPILRTVHRCVRSSRYPFKSREVSEDFSFAVAGLHLHS